MKGVLWKVAKCLSYIQDARCLKVKNCGKIPFENQTPMGAVSQVSYGRLQRNNKKQNYWGVEYRP